MAVIKWRVFFLFFPIFFIHISSAIFPFFLFFSKRRGRRRRRRHFFTFLLAFDFQGFQRR